MSKLTASDTQNYFDSIASNKGLNESSNIDKSSVILNMLLPPKAGKVLEIGGGGGFYTRLFLYKGYNVCVNDLSSKALHHNYLQAKKNGFEHNLTTIHGNFTEVGRGITPQFAQVLIIKLLHHLDDLNAIRELLVCAERVLLPDGRMVIFEPNGRNPLWKPMYSMKFDKESGKSIWFYEQNLRLITEQNLIKCIKDIPSINFTINYHYVIPGFLVERKGLIGKMFKIINSILLKTPLKYFAFNLSLTIDKVS